MANKEFIKRDVQKQVHEMLMPIQMAAVFLNADGSGDGNIIIDAMLEELQKMKRAGCERPAADASKAECKEPEKCVAYVDFGAAIRAVKKGHRIARKGWNGKSQYIELATRVSYIAADGSLVNVDHAAAGNAALAFVGTSGVQLGWLASQADMLAEDWYILEDAK